MATKTISKVAGAAPLTPLLHAAERGWAVTFRMAILLTIRWVAPAGAIGAVLMLGSAIKSAIGSFLP